jgi:hypothetical protein
MKTVMNALTIVGIAAIFGMNGFADTGAQGADKFQKLNGAQIRSQFTGMELSDGTHWADMFGENGILTSNSMGKKRVGKWSVQNNELCLDLEKEISSCFEVWLQGKNAQLRHKGSDMSFLEGVIRKPSARN